MYAAALVLGSLGAAATMLFHPTGGDLLGQSDEIARRGEALATFTHGLAIACCPIVFFGFLGFSKRLGLERPAVAAALVAFGSAMIAGAVAAIINGIVAPVLTRRILTADESDVAVLRLVLANNTAINHAFDKIYLLSASAAILIWSLCLLRAGGWMNMAVGVVGCLVALGCSFGVLSGHVRMDVHGFGLLVAGQIVWFLMAAALLFFEDAGRAA